MIQFGKCNPMLNSIKISSKESEGDERYKFAQ